MRHPRSWMALPVLGLLAACGATPPATQPGATAPETPAHAECRAEARASAPVADLARRWNPNNIGQQARIREEQAEAEARAYTDCLRRRGLMRGGGVERVRQPTF